MVNYPHNLLKDIEEFETLIKNHKTQDTKLNLSQIKFFTPTILLPTINFAENKKINQYIVNDKASSYIKGILGIEKHENTSIPYEKFDNASLSIIIC
jgi:hypothetical protein